MDYKSGKRMSLYGKTKLTPEELAGLLKNVRRRTTYITNKHIAIRGGEAKQFPGIKRWSRFEIDEMMKVTGYYGVRTKPTLVDVRSTYQRVFDSRGDYDCKMHRDDRTSVHRIGCAVHEEEMKRAIPLLSSSNYGHRLHSIVEPFSRKHVRVAHAVKGFYYKRGTGLPPIQD